jgi:hypothetical protein
LYHYLSLLENAEFSLQIIPDRYYTSRFYDVETGFSSTPEKIPPPAIRTADKHIMAGPVTGVIERHFL